MSGKLIFPILILVSLRWLLSLSSVANLKYGIVGSRIALKCNTTERIRWLIPNEDEKKGRIEVRNLTAFLLNLKFDDAGTYSCVNKNTNEIIKSFNVSVLGLIGDSTVNCRQAEICSVACMLNGTRTDFKWQQTERNHLDTPKHFRSLRDTEFTSEEVHGDGFTQPFFKSTVSFIAKTSSRYRCSVATDAAVEVNVPVLDLPRKLFTNFTYLQPVEGDDVNITCLASKFFFNEDWKMHIYYSSPNGTIKKLKDNDPLLSPLGTYLSFGRQMNFRAITKHQTGTFICQVLSRENNQTNNIRIEIHVQERKSLKILKTNVNGSYERKKGEFFQLFCSAIALPIPTVTWFLNNRTINGIIEDRIFINESTLEIVDLKKEYEGEYKCLVKNRIESMTLTTTLAVIEDDTNVLQVGLIEIALIVGGVLVVFLLSFIVLYYRKKRKLKISNTRKINTANWRKGEGGTLDTSNIPFLQQVSQLPFDEKWEFPREKIKLLKAIGYGHFGKVMKADAYEIEPGKLVSTVAVKMLKDCHDEDQRTILMQELKIMSHIGRHLNVLNLLGAVTTQLHRGEFWIIVEYCRYGNLRYYLQQQRKFYVNQVNTDTGELELYAAQVPLMVGDQSPEIRELEICPLTPEDTDGRTIPFFNKDSESRVRKDSSIFGRPRPSTDSTPDSFPLTTRHLICYSYQISKGMEYLSSKELVHRDLAARNILLAEGNIVKICDFGLSKEIFDKHYYRQKAKYGLPWKWMAVECINDGIFTTKSDVWSFGILLWEIFSLGGEPYPGHQVDQEFFNKIKNGYRMEKPVYATTELYKIMKRCWNMDPIKRPAFRELTDLVATPLEETVRQYYQALDNDYLIPLQHRNVDGYMSMKGTQNEQEYTLMNSVDVREEEGEC